MAAVDAHCHPPVSNYVSVNCGELPAGARCIDSMGDVWEYVGMSSWHDYVFAREYRVGEISLSEAMIAHWNGHEKYSDRRKLVKVKE